MRDRAEALPRRVQLNTVAQPGSTESDEPVGAITAEPVRGDSIAELQQPPFSSERTPMHFRRYDSRLVQTSATLDQRRRVLRAALASLAALGGGTWLRDARSGVCSSPDSLFDNGFEASAVGSANSCVLIPSETQGPYPLLSVLSQPGMQRYDIAEGRAGIPLLLELRLLNLSNGCQPIEGAALYLWHCDKDGVYSGYSQPGSNTVGQTFCRGIQFSDCNGAVRLLTIYPGWYAGRITHLHFQIYLDAAGSVTATSQLAFPQAVTQAVYASPLYLARGQNTSVTSFAQDNVFSDGVERQMLNIEGSVDSGYLATIDIGVAL